jgi:hypothetical protein
MHYWLSEDEDCWVLNRVFRLFNTLHTGGFDVKRLLPARTSRLLRDEPKWYALERAEFLRSIEHRKEELAQAGFFRRMIRRSS